VAGGVALIGAATYEGGKRRDEAPAGGGGGALPD